MNAPVYVDIDQGIHKGKLKNARNEKRKKLSGFSFSINTANFEAFFRTKKLISNLFFLKSAVLGIVGNQLMLRIGILNFDIILTIRVNMQYIMPQLLLGLSHKNCTHVFM